MKKIVFLLIILILNISLFSCKEEHVHNFKVDGLCECGEVARVKVIKQVNESSEEIIVKYNETIKKFDDPVIEGLSFVGWYVDEVLFDFTKPITSQVTIYAKFKEIYQVKFLDYDGTVLDTQFVLEGCNALAPINPTREYFEFIGWDTLFNNVLSDLEINAVYQVKDISFNIEYLIDESYWYYNTKEEMVFDFLNDFYDFVNPIESRFMFINGFNGSVGYWVNYIGGSESNNNKLIYNNDIDTINEEYFFNSSKYHDKWYKLAKYVRDNICKGNKRFGYPEVEYNYGALDFKRYIINDPDKYLNSYGGETIFYGFPNDDTNLVTNYKYLDEVILSKPVSRYFKGWYLDSEFTIGPIDMIPLEMIGDISLYPKIVDELSYEITFETFCDIEYPNLEVTLESIVTLPIPIKEGYTFVCWECDYQEVPNTFIYKYNTSIDLKARWKSNNGPFIEYLEYDGKTITYRNSYIPVEIIDTYIEKDQEFRAAWVSSFTSCFKPSTDPILMKVELLRVLDVMESFNMNTILFHLRTHNNAFYKTKLAPIKAEYGTYETFEEWDYLPWFIDECHKRGIEFHAWLNPYRISLSGYSLDCKKEDIAKEYLNYPLNPASKSENILMTIASDKKSLGAILDPSSVEVQDYIVNVCLELMENYDIDGIHFDDYFYARLSLNTNILDDVDQVQYEKYIDETDTNFKKDSEIDKMDWRRLNVDTLIYKLHTNITKFNINNNRSVEFGISPTGVYKSGDGSVSGGSNTTGSGHFGKFLFSDTVKWVKEEWIDYILPQCYTSFNNPNYSFQDITTWWNKVVEGTNVNLYIGLGAHKAIENGYEYSWGNEAYEVNNQLRYLNGLDNVLGVCFFSFNCFNKVLNDPSNIANKGLIKLRDEYWLHKVEIPKTNASIYQK